MLSRQVVKEFLEEETNGIDIPPNILFGDLVEAFCIYVENDYYDWLMDNFKSFFDHRNPDWDLIGKRIEQYSKY